MQAFTLDMICSAWKATGLLLYNPIIILKTFTYIKPFKSQDIKELNTPITLYTLNTPRTIKETKSLYNQINK